MTVIYNMSIDRADKPWIGDRRFTEYCTFGLNCLLLGGFLSAQLLLGPPRPRILRCFQICAQNWQQPSGTEVVAVQSWGPGPIK